MSQARRWDRAKRSKEHVEETGLADSRAIVLLGPTASTLELQAARERDFLMVPVAPPVVVRRLVARWVQRGAVLPTDTVALDPNSRTGTSRWAHWRNRLAPFRRLNATPDDGRYWVRLRKRDDEVLDKAARAKSEAELAHYRAEDLIHAIVEAWARQWSATLPVFHYLGPGNSAEVSGAGGTL